jgi:hypothetical protein
MQPNTVTILPNGKKRITPTPVPIQQGGGVQIVQAPNQVTILENGKKRITPTPVQAPSSQPVAVGGGGVKMANQITVLPNGKKKITPTPVQVKKNVVIDPLVEGTSAFHEKYITVEECERRCNNAGGAQQGPTKGQQTFMKKVDSMEERYKKLDELEELREMEERLERIRMNKKCKKYSDDPSLCESKNGCRYSKKLKKCKASKSPKKKTPPKKSPKKTPPKKSPKKKAPPKEKSPCAVHKGKEACTDNGCVFFTSKNGSPGCRSRPTKKQKEATAVPIQEMNPSLPFANVTPVAMASNVANFDPALPYAPATLY